MKTSSKKNSFIHFKSQVPNMNVCQTCGSFNDGHMCANPIMVPYTRRSSTPAAVPVKAPEVIAVPVKAPEVIAVPVKAPERSALVS